jgi:hypothetical protein
MQERELELGLHELFKSMKGGKSFIVGPQEINPGKLGKIICEYKDITSP